MLYHITLKMINNKILVHGNILENKINCSIKNVLRSTLLHANKTTNKCIQFLIEYWIKELIAVSLLCLPMDLSTLLHLNDVMTISVLSIMHMTTFDTQEQYTHMHKDYD